MAYVQVPADGAGKRVDTVTLTDALAEVHRQKMVVTGGSGTAEVVVVTNAAAAAADMGLVVRHAGTLSAAITNTVNVAAVAISGTATIAGVVGLTAGAANIGFINHVSATVTVAGNVNISTMPAVVLAAGAANIGTLNDISRTVQVAVGTPFTLNNISATVTVAGNVNISTMPAVVLAAGANNIGTVNDISRTVQVAVGTPFTVNNISATVNVVVTRILNTAEVPSASRGPKLTTVSTSANVTLVAAPGAGLSVFVTQLAVSNAGAVGSRARVGASASAGTNSTVQMFMASAGGGFVMQFEPPWQLSANEALLGSVKPNTSDALFNVNFFVASADAI